MAGYRVERKKLPSRSKTQRVHIPDRSIGSGPARRARPVTLGATVLVAALLLAAGCSTTPLSPTTPDVIVPVEAPPEPPPPPPPPPPHLQVGRILTFGDSLTEGAATPLALDPSMPGLERSYPYKLQALLTARYTDQTVSVYNGGLGGEDAMSQATAGRLVDLLRQLHPDVVILLEGVNDLNAGVPIPTVIGAIEGLIGEARARGAHVLLSTLPPQRPGGPKASSVDQIVPFNDEIRKTAADEGATLVDIYPLITLDLVAPDGLHMTQAGNDVLAQAFLNALISLYEIPAS
jgi:lysophospholipase L1-like esterase